MWIDGNLYHALLEDNRALADAIRAPHRIQVQGRHFKGRLEEVPGSWVRISRFSGQWRGVVSLFDALHRVGGPADGTPVSSKPVAQAFNAMEEKPTCGASAQVPQALNDDGGTPSVSALSSPTVSAATYNEICAEKIGGICLLAELEMIFDDQFRTHFPTDYQDQAVSLLNIVEGYYAQLDIAFKTLSMNYPETEQFTSSTSAGAYLGDDSDPEYDGNGIAQVKNSLAFIRNQQALLHVVTGRDFDGSVVGLAWDDVLCNGSGYSSGTSQVLTGGSGNPDIALTAIVAAHEIGHNFSAVHDGDNSCSSTGYIMEASLSRTSPPSSFSSCSVSEMQGAIESLDSGIQYDIDQCFGYPVDSGIAADSGNPSQVDGTTGDTLDLFFNLSYQETGGSATAVIPFGLIPADDGTLVEVALDGDTGACIIDSDIAFECTGTKASNQVRVRVHSTGTQLRLMTGVSVEGNNVKDTNSANDTAAAMLNVTLASEQPDDLAAEGLSNAIRLTWTDRGRGESGYEIQRKRSDGGSWATLTTIADNSESYEDSTVTLLVSYDYRVIAMGTSGTSNIASAVAGQVPVAPSGLVATTSSGAVLLAWQDNATTETGYRVERSTDGSSWTTIANLAADSISYQDTTVTAGLQYQYRVLADNAAGTSAPSNQVQAGLPGASAPADSGGGGSFWMMLFWLPLLMLRRAGEVS